MGARPPVPALLRAGGAQVPRCRAMLDRAAPHTEPRAPLGTTDPIPTSSGC